jgi:hypothetical protein
MPHYCNYYVLREDKIVPVIIGALGVIKKRTVKNLQSLSHGATEDYTNEHCIQNS